MIIETGWRVDRELAEPAAPGVEQQQALAGTRTAEHAEKPRAGAELEMRGKLHRSCSGWRGTLDVAGETVEARFRFVGALPRMFAP